MIFLRLPGIQRRVLSVDFTDGNFLFVLNNFKDFQQFTD